MPIVRVDKDVLHDRQLELDERTGGGTTMTVQSTFASAEAMAQLLEMGMEEGMRQAMGQIDAILADVD